MSKTLLVQADLNTLVSSAIWRAEQLEAGGVAALQVWSEVSLIEEKLANVHLPTTVQGEIARRGAVRAACKAGDYKRACQLVDSYCSEKGATKALRTTLKEILSENAISAS